MPADLLQWINLALGAIALGTTIYAWFAKSSDKAIADVKALRAELESDADKQVEKQQRQSDAVVARFQHAESRLLKIESDLTHLPDREQTHRLELAVERLTGRMETLDERLKPVAAISDRLQEFLLEQAGRR